MNWRRCCGCMCCKISTILSDEATAVEVIDNQAFSEFCGVDPSNQVPDGDTIGRFRNILVRNGLQEKLFAQEVEMLQQKGFVAQEGNQLWTPH